MKLIQPIKKNDRANLDLTIQLDEANEEVQVDEEGKANIVLEDNFESLNTSSDFNLHDTLHEPKNPNFQARYSLQSRMIGEIH